MSMARLTCVAFLAAVPSLAFAQDEDALARDNDSVVYAERTELEFEGLDVEGSLARPSGVAVSVRRIGEFNPMIQLRTDFHSEIVESLDFMK